MKPSDLFEVRLRVSQGTLYLITGGSGIVEYRLVQPC